jgi:hypothetical protein
VERGKFVEADGAGLVQPAQVSGEISERGFHEHPSAGLRDLSKAFERMRIDIGRRRLDDAIEVGVRSEAESPDDGSGVRQQVDFGGVAADQRQQRELLERPLE